ncbi:MFS transporter [Halomonas sp. HAL1]|uniref:MFS transporter n=1 Tax=Halomonas sp. HAL1 TaxID=550984 RepID=UPI00022D2D11|nr:MFS transporter [Halomonas sp. HAL1]EHA14563.1 integral membrane transport protein [Halomonas sp. HAL1]WKV93774.1 MFS transporter [Halomonas sp. HAL1]
MSEVNRVAPVISKKQQFNAVFVAALCVITAGSYATLSGLLTSQLIKELGWTTLNTTFGITINMILYGATAPFAIHLMEKYGIKKIVILSLSTLCIGALFCTINSKIIFNLAWGILVGLGCGSLTMSFGALFARSWFKKTGLPTGILTASSVTGQFVLLPLWAKLANEFSWRAPLIGCIALTLVTLLIIYLVFNEKMSAIKTVTEYNIKPDSTFADVFIDLKKFMKNKKFWVIALAFGMCGATTNGLMWSSFTPAASLEGISVADSSYLLLIIGLLNIPGTIGAGWLSDKINKQKLLSVIFILRGASLICLPFILSQPVGWELIVFAVVFGVFDVATVPPVINLCNQIFGDRGPFAFSWINVAHQIGAGLVAFLGGVIAFMTGSYFTLWFIAGGIFFTAAIIVLTPYHSEKAI